MILSVLRGEFMKGHNIILWFCKKVSTMKSKNDSLNRADFLSSHSPSGLPLPEKLLERLDFRHNFHFLTVHSVPTSVPTNPWTHVKVLGKVTHNLLAFT